MSSYGALAHILDQQKDGAASGAPEGSGELAALRLDGKSSKFCLFTSLSVRLQVQAAAPRPVGGAAAGLLPERGAAAGQAAVPVPQHGARLLVRSGLPADPTTHRRVGGAEEDRVGGARPVVKAAL